MGVDADAKLFYGFVEPHYGTWEMLGEVDGNDYEVWEKKLEHLDIEHGYLGDGSPRFIAAKLFSVSHRWPQVIDPADMAVKPEWDLDLREFCKLLEIDLGVAKPEWHLVSYFG